MPRVKDLIDRVGNAMYIITIDLTKGYWQVPVAEEDREKTAYGLYQFTRMPFGLQGAPATFQRMVDHLLDSLGDFASVYMDNLVIYSSTWDEHLHHLSSVLECIHKAGPTVKKNSRCQNVECNRAFRSLKDAFVSSPVLCSPNFTQPFVLQTDASDRGVGGVLSQYDENGQDRPISLNSVGNYSLERNDIRQWRRSASQ
jgi:phospholipid-translocating ATPase